jgi:hypothetical protein
MRLVPLFIAILFCFHSAWTQQKFEREVRIDPSVVPATAIEFVKQLQFSSKIKWFKETGLNRNSFEAKTKSKGNKYSIEFDVQGRLEDVEIIIQKKKLPSEVRQKITEQLQKDLSKFKWGKIQIQYSGDAQAVRKKVMSETSSEEGLIIRYEIIVSAKINKKYQQFEYLFSHEGSFLEKKNILLQNTDNLEY